MKKVYGLLIASFFMFIGSPANAGLLLDSTTGVKLHFGADYYTEANVPTGFKKEGGGFRGNGAGFGWGANLYYELSLVSLVSVETGLGYRVGKIQKEVKMSTTGATGKFQEYIEVSSLKLPLLLKLNIPMGLSSFVIGIGPEYSVTLGSSAGFEDEEGSLGPAWKLIPEEVNSMFMTYLLGLQLGVGPIEVPIFIQAAQNLSQEQDWQKRVTQDGVDYKVKTQSSWEFRVGAGIGFSL